jgi:hypothetical protein
VKSAVNFGYERRAKGRHVALELVAFDPDPRPLSQEERAAKAYGSLAHHLATVPVDEDTDTIELRNDAASVVVCGDPECAGEDGSGRWVGFRDRCPKCGGYAATLGEFVKRKLGVRA